MHVCEYICARAACAPCMQCVGGEGEKKGEYELPCR